MKTTPLSRRQFVGSLPLATCTASLTARTSSPASASPQEPLHLSTNQYSWFVFYRREGLDLNQSIDLVLADVAASGLNGFEPTLQTVEEVRQLQPRLKKNGLEMRSFYVNSTLHRPESAEKSIADIVAVAREAQRAGARIAVTNPNPIRWGGPEAKSDEELRFQAQALNRLGEKLSELGVVLAYHNHDVELQNAAREFHHMMLGTDPRYVSLCLDAHWMYRGSGNSSVALFDIVRLYGERVREVHLRQSRDNVWSETFGPGDIDFKRLARELRGHSPLPHLVLEQAVEKGTPHTMNPREAHTRSAAFARSIFSQRY